MKGLLSIFSVIVYSISIRVYYLIIVIASLKNKKAKQWVAGRKNLIRDLPKPENKKPVWFHVSSLGEFEQGRPIIEALKNSSPDLKIILTFFSPSGYEIRKNYTFADYISYLPLDTKKNARKFIKCVQPGLAVFIKYDFWYHYIDQLYKTKTPTLLVSAIFNKKQIFFKWYGQLYRNLLGKFDHLFVQDTESKALLESLNITKVKVINDTRIDRAFQISEEAKKIKYPAVESFCDNKAVLLGGSTHEKEIELLQNLFNDQEIDLKLIVVPHHVDSENIKKVKNHFGNAQLWSSLDPEKQDMKACDVLIVDVIGILAYLYQYSDMVLIGGGFDTGIHNVLEPATFGKPILFGPKNHEKFNEALRLLNLGGASLIADSDTFRTQVIQLMDEKERMKRGQICREFIVNNLGGTRIVTDHILSLS